MKIRRMFDTFDAYGWETPSHEIAEKVGLRDGADQQARHEHFSVRADF